MDKDKANSIADALLEKERQASARLLRRPPLLIRSAASGRLPRDQEWELFRRARRDLFASRTTAVVVCMAPSVLMVLFWFFMDHPVRAWYVVSMMVAGMVPYYLVVFHLRKELARLAREHYDPK
jgi:hypothetical protein